MIYVLYLPTASDRGLVWHGHSSKRWDSAQLLTSPVGRLYYSVAVAVVSHMSAAVRSDADAARALSLSLSLAGSATVTTVLYQTQQMWPDNKAEQVAVGDMVLSTSNSITRSEVKPHRLGRFLICQPLPGSCWSQKRATTLKPCEQGPQRHCAHVPGSSEAVMSLLSQRTVFTCKRSSLPLPLHIPELRCCNFLWRSISRYLSHRSDMGAA